MKTPKVKTRTVKGYAIVYGGEIENEAYFTDGGCCCADEPNSLAVYKHKRDADRNLSSWNKEHKVMPIKITYKF